MWVKCRAREYLFLGIGVNLADGLDWADTVSAEFPELMTGICFRFGSWYRCRIPKKVRKLLRLSGLGGTSLHAVMADGGRFLEKVESLRKKSFFQLKYSINACAVYRIFQHVHDFFFAGWKNVARAAGYACRVGGKMLARSRENKKTRCGSKQARSDRGGCAGMNCSALRRSCRGATERSYT